MKNNEVYNAKVPEGIPKLFVEFWNSKDAINLSNLFVKDAEFVNVVGLWWHNREQIYKAHDYGLKKIFKNSTLEVRKLKVKYLSSDIALVHSRFKLIDQSSHSDISETGSRQNIFTFVVQKQENSWLCVAAHNTDIIPGMETNIVDNTGKVKAVNYRK